MTIPKDFRSKWLGTGSNRFHTETFDATATLTKNSDNIEIDAGIGDTIRIVRLTLGAPV